MATAGKSGVSFTAELTFAPDCGGGQRITQGGAVQPGIPMGAKAEGLGLSGMAHCTSLMRSRREKNRLACLYPAITKAQSEAREKKGNMILKTILDTAYNLVSILVQVRLKWGIRSF